MVFLNRLLLVFSLLILFSCKKNNNEIDICKAGVINEKMNYFDFNPDSIFNNISLDLNNDGKFDVNLRADVMASPNGHDYVSVISILDSSFQIILTSDSLSPQTLNFNDIIDKNNFWKYLNGPILFVRDYNVWAINYHYQFDYWLNKIGFIGIRNEYSKGQYKYGWIKISVESYTKIIIYDYSFMK